VFSVPDEKRQTLRRRLLALLIAGVGSMAATAISFGMTVYEAAHPKPVPSSAPGQSIDTGRWIVTLREAHMGARLPTGSKPFNAKRVLTVTFDLDNRSAYASNAYAGLMVLDPPIPDLPRPSFYLGRDKWVAGSIQPDMPERLIAAWDWPQAAPEPQELRLKIISQIYKRRDNLYGAPGWFDRDPVAIVTLPVTAQPAQVQP
jgi:hypothetical protein